MWTLALAQVGPLAVGATPTWVGPTVAISLAVLAVSILGIAIGLLVLMLKVSAQVKTLGQTVGGLQGDVAGTLQAVRRLTEQGQDLMVVVRNEAGAFAQSGRRLRRRLERGADGLQHRLEDLAALYDVVHTEVEDTALDVAAGLRSVRRGNGMIGRVRRLLVASR